MVTTGGLSWDEKYQRGIFHYLDPIPHLYVSSAVQSWVICLEFTDSVTSCSWNPLRALSPRIFQSYKIRMNKSYFGNSWLFPAEFLDLTVKIYCLLTDKWQYLNCTFENDNTNVMPKSGGIFWTSIVEISFEYHCLQSYNFTITKTILFIWDFLSLSDASPCPLMIDEAIHLGNKQILS